VDRKRVLWPRVDREVAHSQDKVVQFIAWALGWFQTVLNRPFYAAPAGWASRRWNHGEPWLYFNYIYSAWWALLVVGFFVLSPCIAGWGQLVIVSIALWRVAEILTWYVKLLFDKRHRVFLEVERNFFFLIADALILVTALALALETVEEGSRARRWADAFSAFTLNGAPGGYNSGWAAAVGVLGAIGGLALLGAGLGIVIGIISDRIKESQDAVAEEGVPRSYTGPTRPAPPWEEGAPRRLFSRAWRRLKRTQS